MSGCMKKSTGLTGLAVAVNPHHTLGALYSKILRAVGKMPDDSVYRTSTERIINERASIVKCTTSVPEIEKKINCGQVEELIIQAENELMLARKMLGWQPWDKLCAKAPPQQWDWPPSTITDPKM